MPIAKMARKSKQVGPVVLQATLIELCHTIKSRMVVQKAINKRKVQASPAGFFKAGEIRIVWQKLVNLIRQRVGRRVWGGLRKFSYEPAIFIASFKYEGLPTRVPCCLIQYQFNILRPWVGIDKRCGA